MKSNKEDTRDKKKKRGKKRKKKIQNPKNYPITNKTYKNKRG